MDPALLIDGILRQTIDLIARLVTAAEHRPALADLPDRVFVELNDALRRRGVRASLLAGLFGLKLRTYHDRVRRAREALEQHEIPLFGAVFRLIRDEGPIERWVIDGRFSQAHPKVLAAVLDDLVASELVFQTGRGPATRYGVLAGDAADGRAEAAARLVWVTLYHRSPASRAQLEALLGDGPTLDAALARLEAEGRIEALDDGQRWRCADYAIPLGDRAGWPAAVFDHVQAVVQTLVAKLDAGQTRAGPTDAVGGSTYVFEVGDGHPHDAEVLALLAETRRRLDALREKVLAVNAQSPTERPRRVVFYFGQHVR